MPTGYPDTMSNAAAGIFRAYDIRGVVGEDLTSDVAVLVGKAFGTTVLRGRGNRVLIGRDGRLSSPELSSCLLYTSPSPRDLSTSRMPSSA